MGVLFFPISGKTGRTGQLRHVMRLNGGGQWEKLVQRIAGRPAAAGAQSAARDEGSALGCRPYCVVFLLRNYFDITFANREFGG